MRQKKAFINIISSIALQIVIVICGFIVPRLIIKSFGSNVNGLVASITQFLAYIALLESGFGPVVKSILYKPIANNNKDEIEQILKSSQKFFRIVSLIFIAYIIVLCIVLPSILSKQFNEIYTLSLILIISISTFAEYYFGMTYRLYLQAEQKTYIISLIYIGTTILNTLMIVILINANANIQIVKLISAIIFAFRPILQNIYVKKKYGINLKKAENGYKIKQKWDGLAQHIAAVVHNNTDIVILTIFTNTTEVSVYSVYYMVVSGVKNLIQSFSGGIDALFGDMIARGEKESLNKTFKTYEGFYFTISTIICISTLLLIVPFICVYTRGITDANYIRPLFSYLIVLSEFMWVIRLPYSSITLAAGHFKQTRNGAIVEAIINIVLSIILVWNYGIVGVAIGTLIAMFVRTIEFMYHTSKYILDRSVLYTFKRLLVIAIEGIIVTVIVNLIPNINIISYFTWIVQAIIVASISSLVVITINCIVYKENVKNVTEIARKILKRG